MEGRTWLLLALSCASFFGAGFSQCSTLPDAMSIQTSILSIVSGQGGEGTDPVITLLQHHFTCIAVGTTEGTFRSLSIAVRYNVTSMDNPAPRQRIRQLLLECSDSNFVPQSTTALEPNQPESVFNLTTRRDCRFCIAAAPTDNNCDGKSIINVYTDPKLLFLLF